jgi:hypothetical protein
MPKLLRTTGLSAVAVLALAFGASVAGAQEIGSSWFLWEPGTHTRAAASTFEPAVPFAEGAVRRAAPQATNPGECEPGAYWYIQTEEYPQSAVPMACPVAVDQQ